MANPFAAPRTQYLEKDTPQVGNNSSNTIVLGVAQEDAAVTSVAFIPVDVITGDNDASRTLSVVNVGGDGNGSTTLASVAFITGQDADQFGEIELELSETAADLNLAAGDIVVFVSMSVGEEGGAADPGGYVRVTFDRR